MGCRDSIGINMGINVCSVPACSRLLPPCPIPAHAGGSRELRASGNGRDASFHPITAICTGQQTLSEAAVGKERFGVFFLYCAQRVPALGFSRTGLVGRSAGAAKPGPSSLSRQSCAEVGAHKSRGTEDARSDPGHHPGCSCSGLAWHLYQF